ncbi:MAG: hypothetical protein KTR14_02350 [Vampirovibrio sp.]|nr:hypothetical protein [Vampirovibrio sp.]
MNIASIPQVPQRIALVGSPNSRRSYNPANSRQQTVPVRSGAACEAAVGLLSWAGLIALGVVAYCFIKQYPAPSSLNADQQRRLKEIMKDK